MDIKFLFQLQTFESRIQQLSLRIPVFLSQLQIFYIRYNLT